MSNEEKTNDYENFEKGMIYMKILKKRGVVEKRGEYIMNNTCILCPHFFD
jgi:CTP synthase (UTP-ammonia lyase)